MRTLTVVVPTYNRASRLDRALRCLTTQSAVPVPLRIVVVDNNSSDSTAAVVQSYGGRVQYAFEENQGLAHARNAGILSASPDDVVAFTDDDVEVAGNWAATLAREFGEHPEVECVGGRVLPRWNGAPPAWLTREHWGPLALQDHGNEPREFDRSRPVCLVGANVAFRRPVFDRIGLFSPHVQRVKDGIGSTEDHELLRRLYEAGGRARYVPDLVVTTEVPAERLTRAYHRRWHAGHGKFQALMRLPDLETSRRGRILGVPAHLYRSAARDAAAWVGGRLSGDTARAFAAETRLWFFTGFLLERCPCVPRR